MRARIGKYINSQKIKYADIDVNTSNRFYAEIVALRNDVDLIVESSNKTCTLKEFKKNNEVYLLTDNKKHKEEFQMSNAFWIVIDEDGCWWNLDILEKNHVPS